MKKNLLVVSVVAVLFSVAAFAAQGVYGTWAFPPISQGNISFNVTMTVAKDTLSMKNVCTVNGQSAVAQITARATITDRNVTVLEAKEDRQSQNGVDCNISVTPSAMDYSVSADDASLTLSMPGQGSMVLSRQ